MKIRIDRLALVAVWLGSMVWASAAMAAPNRMQELMETARTDALAHPGHVRRLGCSVACEQPGEAGYDARSRLDCSVEACTPDAQ